MNEVKLTDFDTDTLSQINALLIGRKRDLLSRLSILSPNSVFRKHTDKELENITQFQTQLLYAFSLVKESEKVTSN